MKTITTACGTARGDSKRTSVHPRRLSQVTTSFLVVVSLAGRCAKDVLGRVYEYFLSQFASAEGKKGGEFYTPRCVAKLLVEMLEPYRGRVYDPCCGSSGMSRPESIDRQYWRPPITQSA